MSTSQMILPGNRAFNSNGLIIPSATAELYASGGTTPANFYADGGLVTSLGPTLTANGAGRFPTAYQDNSVAFRLIVKDAEGVELDDIDPYYFGTSTFTTVSSFVTPQMYGAVGDNVTDDGPAFASAIAALAVIATNSGYGYGGQGCPTLFVPAGEYYMGTTTLDILKTIRIVGEGNGQPSGPSTVLRWAAATTGIRVQIHNTSGATTTVTSRVYAGNGSIFEGLFLRGGYSGTESESYGFHLRGFATIRDCYVDNFAGDGIYAVATIGDATTNGNASETRCDNVTISACRNGVYLDGADSNASLFTGVDSRDNRMWGFWDSSFLGNTFIGCRVSANGWDGALGSTPTACTIGGSRYYVKPGQATGASTNAPVSSVVTMTIASPGVVTWNAHGMVAGTPVSFATTGALPTGLVANTTYYVVSPAANTFSVAATVGGAAINTSGSQSGVHTAGAGKDNTYWGFYAAGGIYNSVVPWVSGTTFREGGGYKTDNANAESLFLGCYQEDDQNPSQVMPPSMMVGGFLSANNRTQALALRTDATGGLIVGPTAGTPSSLTSCFNVTGTSHILQGKFFVGGVGTVIGSLGFYNGFGNIYDIATGLQHLFRVNGTNEITLDANGIDLATGNVLKVNATQVVAARDTGWSADTGTAEKTAHATYAGGTANATYLQAEITAIRSALQDVSRGQKAIKDALIAHGLIGT